MNVIEILILIAGLCFICKICLHIFLKQKSTSRTATRMLFGIYGLEVIFPIFRRPTNSQERRLIRLANIFVYLFYAFFLASLTIGVIIYLR
jgi:hypothetical protein